MMFRKVTFDFNAMFPHCGQIENNQDLRIVFVIKLLVVLFV